MVIRVPRQDCKCTVDLFADEDAGELVGKGHGAEGEQQASAGAIGAGPAVGRTEREDGVLAAFVALAAQPLGQRLRGKLFAAFVEHDQQRRGSAFEAVDPLEKRSGGFEYAGFGFGIDLRPLQVLCGGRVEALALRADRDGGEGDLHGRVNLGLVFGMRWMATAGEYDCILCNYPFQKYRLLDFVCFRDQNG